MKRVSLLILVAAALIPTLAGGQANPPTPQAFVPITLDRPAYEDLRRRLGQIRFDDALPIMIWLETLEQNAQQQAAVAQAKRKEEGGR